MDSESIKDQLREVLIEKDQLREVLIEMDVPSKKDVKKIVEDVFHEQITNYHHDMAMPEINALRKDINIFKERNNLIIDALKTLKQTIDQIKTEISFIKSEIRNLSLNFYEIKLSCNSSRLQ